jgi:hypothetical protein
MHQAGVQSVNNVKGGYAIIDWSILCAADYRIRWGRNGRPAPAVVTSTRPPPPATNAPAPADRPG